MNSDRQIYMNAVMAGGNYGNHGMGYTTVPMGWNRTFWGDGSVVYVSPSGHLLHCAEDLQRYLLAEGTCKCGLECPLIIDRVFNFNPRVPARPKLPADVLAESQLASLCKHRHNLVAMAEALQGNEESLANACHPGGASVFGRSKGSKRTRSKSKPEPGIDFKHLNSSSSQFIALQGGHMHPFPGIASFMPSMDSVPFDHRLQQHSIESRQRHIQMHMLQMQHQELMQQHQHMQHQLHHQQHQHQQQQNPLWRGNLEIESVLHSPVEQQPVEQRGGKHCHSSPPSSCINQSFPQRSASVQQDASASKGPHCAAPGSSKSPRPIGELTSPVAKDRQLIHGHGSLPFGFHVEAHPAHGEAQPPGIHPDACTPNVIPLLSNMYHAPHRASLITANISNNPVLFTNQSDVALLMQDGSKESSVGLEKAALKVPTSKPCQLEDVAKHGRKSPEGTVKDGNLSPTVSKATTMHTSCTKPEKTFSTGNISLQQIFKQSIEGSAFPASSLLTAAARAQLAKHPQSPDSPSPRHAGDLMSGMGLFKELPPNLTTKEPKLLLGASHGGGTAISSANQKHVAQSSNPSDIVNMTERNTEDTSLTHKIGESPIQCLENAVQNLKDQPKASRSCASTSAVSSPELTQVSSAGRKRLSIEDSTEGSTKRQRLQSGDSSHGRASVECEIIHSEAALLTPQVPEITNKHSSMHHQDTTKVTGSYSVVCSTGKPRNTNKHSAVDNSELARWQQQQQEWYANTLRAKQQHGAGNIPIEHLPPGAVMGQPTIRSRGLQELQYIALGGNPSQRMPPRQQHPNMGHMHRFPNRFMNPLFNSHATNVMHQGHGMPMPYRMDLPVDALDPHISPNPNMCNNSTILQSMLQQQQLQQLGLLPPGNFHQVPHMNPGQHVDPSQQTDMPNLPQAHSQAALKAGTSSQRRKGSKLVRSASASSASAPVSDLDEEEPKDAAYWVKAASKLGGVKKVKDILAMTRSLKKHNSEAGEVEAIFQAVLDSASGGMKVIIKEGTRSQPAAQSKSTYTDQGKGFDAKPPEHSPESVENSDSSCDVFEKVTDDSEKQTQPSQLEQSDDTQSVKDTENIPTADDVKETDRDSSNMSSVTETELPELPAEQCAGEQAGSDSIDEVESATNAALSSEQTQDENLIQDGTAMESEGSSQTLIKSEQVPTPDHDELDSEHDAILEQKSNPTVGEESPVSDLSKVEPSTNNSPTESASCLESIASASQMPIEHDDGLQNVRFLVPEPEDNGAEPIELSSDKSARENVTEMHLDDTKSICQTTAMEDKSLSPTREVAPFHEPGLIPAEVKTDVTFDQSCVEEETEPSTISVKSLDSNAVDTESDAHVLPEQHLEITSATPDGDDAETSVQPVQVVEYTRDQDESSDLSASMVTETHSNTDTKDPTGSTQENAQHLPESTEECPNSVGPLSNTALVEGESLSSFCLTEAADDTEDAGSSEHQMDEHVTSKPSQENAADQHNETSQTTVLVSEDLVISTDTTDTECEPNVIDHAQIDSEQTKQDIAENKEQVQADSFKDPTTQDSTSDEQTVKQNTMIESESVDQPGHSEPITQNQQTKCESVEHTSIDDEPMEQGNIPDSKSMDANQASDCDQVIQDIVTDNQLAEQSMMLQNDKIIDSEPIAQDEDVHIPGVKENTETDNEQGNKTPPMEGETAKQSQSVSSEPVKQMDIEPVRLDHAIDVHQTEHETTVDHEPDKENQLIHNEPTKQDQGMVSKAMNYEDTMDTQTVGTYATDDSQPAKQEQTSNSEPMKEDQFMDIEPVTLEENTENRKHEQNLLIESESMPDDVTGNKVQDGPHETGLDTTCTVDSEPVKQHPLMDIEPETEEMEKSQQMKHDALENIEPGSHSLSADDEPGMPNEIVDDQQERLDTLLNSEPVKQDQPMDIEPVKSEEMIGSQQLQHDAIVDCEPVKQDEPMDSEPVKFEQVVDSQQVDHNAATDRRPVNQYRLMEREPVKCDQAMDSQNVKQDPSADSDLVEQAQQMHSAPVEHPDEEMDSLQQECDAMVDREPVKQVQPQECEPVKIDAKMDNQDEQDPSVDSEPVNSDQPVIKYHIGEEPVKQDELGKCESLVLGQNSSQSPNQGQFLNCELDTVKPEQSPSAPTGQGEDSQSSNLSTQVHWTDGELDKRNLSENKEQERHDIIRQECQEDSDSQEVGEDLSGNSQTLKDDQEPQTSEPHQCIDLDEQDDVLMLVEPLSPDGNKQIIEDQSTPSSINLADSSTNIQAQLGPVGPAEESLSDVHRCSDENLNNNRSTSDEDVTCVDNPRSNTSSICLDFQSEDDTSDVLLLDLDTLGNEEANPEPFPEQEHVSFKELSKSPHAAESQSLETPPPEVLHASRNSLDERDPQATLCNSQDDSTMHGSESVLPRDRLLSAEGSSPPDVSLDTLASSEIQSEDLPVTLNGPLSTSPNPSEQETKSEIIQSQAASPPSDSFKDLPTTQEEPLSREEGITPNGVLESSSFDGSPVDSQINQSQCLQGLTQECTTKEEKRSGSDDERENRENKPLTDEPPVQETVRRETNLKRGISETQKGVLSAKEAGFKRERLVQEAPTRVLRGNVRTDPSPEFSSSMFPRHLEIGDLVWGPIRGHPSWPGKLVSETEVRGRSRREEGKMWVRWFGDHSCTQVEPEKLKTLSEGLEAHHSARQSNRSRGLRINSTLEAAIQEAMNELDKKMEQAKDTKTKPVPKTTRPKTRCKRLR